MTKGELKKEATEYALEWGDKTDGTYACCLDGYLAGAEPREKRIAELETKISVLLSCKNCSENKGGLLCQKEYEDKCLAQKIQYIKELQEENAELIQENEEMKKGLGCETCQIHLEHMSLNNRIADLEKENAELQAQIEKMKGLLEKWYNQHSDKTYTKTFYDELIKATEAFLWSDVCVK